MDLRNCIVVGGLRTEENRLSLTRDSPANLYSRSSIESFTEVKCKSERRWNTYNE